MAAGLIAGLGAFKIPALIAALWQIPGLIDTWATTSTQKNMAAQQLRLQMMQQGATERMLKESTERKDTMLEELKAMNLRDRERNRMREKLAIDASSMQTMLQVLASTMGSSNLSPNAIMGMGSFTPRQPAPEMSIPGMLRR